MDIFYRHKYYCIAQVEDVTADNAYVVSFDIISAIFKILTGLSEGLSCVGRVGRSVGKMDVPAYNSLLPTLEEIENMNCTEKTESFFKILNLDDTFNECLNLFPYSWHIYILAIKYASDKSKLNSPPSIFFDHNWVYKICSNIHEEILRKTEHTCRKPKKYLAIHMIRLHLAINSLIEIWVHSISEFQSILLHLKYLNNLLQRPFHDFCVSDCLNCTFVYNFTANLAKRGNIENYLDSLLCKAPTVLRTVHTVINVVKEFAAVGAEKANPPPKRHKKKKQVITSILMMLQMTSQREKLGLIQQ
nr:unnamed protein product [Callosobruchus analis]